MEGYPESVKFLHKNTNWNHTAPILSDIIYVKEEFRAAVENVLEPYLNYYVVNNLQEGLQAVHLLDDNKKGKNSNSLSVDEFIEYVSKGWKEGKNTIGAGIGEGVVEKWFSMFGDDYQKVAEAFKP